ncbi:tetratricopeptide repeat protein [Geomobilimonas luticola]|uniref:tetratricopeptide repeat protein n=1 Tax=Geomobilimonas luticola TaxID=1114878 RepID=UPI001BD997BA|nr:tetratricopeptide repeat protein [Geomobilimonas luticola]
MFSGNVPRQSAGICLALIVMVFALYFQVGNHAFLNYDDNVYVTANPNVAGGITGESIIWAFTSFDASNWHPLTWLSHMVDVELFGMDPRGHHLTSVAIHALSTVLLFLLLLRITGSRWHSSCVAVFFAIHPLHVESVAWVAERKDVLSAFFWFLTLLLYASYTVQQKRVFYLLALASFALGLMAKPMLVTLPVVMLLLDYWPLGRCRTGGADGEGRSFRVLVREKVPFFACALASSILTVFAQRSEGAIKSLGAVPFPLRLENSLVSYGAYLGNIIWPDDLAILYPIPSSYPLWQVIGSLFVLLFVSVATVRARHRFPYLAVGWLWFLVTLVPVIGLLQVGVQSMADRYTYIPSIGLFIMAVWGIPELLAGFTYRMAILTLLAGAVIGAKTAVTWQQLGYWRDNFSLYEQTLKVTDDNYVIHNNLGIAHADAWNLDAAIGEFRKALRINPNYAEAHYNLGIALAMKGELDMAIREFREALRIHPGDAKANYNLGVALEQKRQLLGSGK